MSESTEETHYQVALTNGQVLTAFAVLLACIVAAFFAGVWIGRGSNRDARPYQVAAEGGEEGGEFDFFSGDDTLTDAPASPAAEVPAAAEAAPPKRLSRTLTEPPRDEPAPAKAAEKPAAKKPAESAPEPEPAASESLPPPEPMPRRQAETAPAPTASAATPDVPADGEGFQIQVLATSDRGKAQELVDRLQDADFRAYLSPTGAPGREIYRVRVGPLPSRELAQTQAEELERRWGLESWITPGGP